MSIRWGKGQPEDNDGHKCARYDPIKDEIVSFWCSDELCPICEVQPPIKFQMNGPNVENIDNHSVMTDVDTFNGYRFTDIVHENDMFKIQDAATGFDIACTSNIRMDSPIGTHPWYPRCPLDPDLNATKVVANLHQYVKLPGQFDCGNGLIDSKYVCDTVIHCEGGSDEHNCDCTVIPNDVECNGRIDNIFHKIEEDQITINVSISVLEFLDLKYILISLT